MKTKPSLLEAVIVLVVAIGLDFGLTALLVHAVLAGWLLSQANCTRPYPLWPLSTCCVWYSSKNEARHYGGLFLLYASRTR